MHLSKLFLSLSLLLNGYMAFKFSTENTQKSHSNLENEAWMCIQLPWIKTVEPTFKAVKNSFKYINIYIFVHY